MLTAAIGRLFAVAEAYPELRATENFQQLQAELAETEARIAISRQVYNDTVLTYNNALRDGARRTSSPGSSASSRANTSRSKKPPPRGAAGPVLSAAAGSLAAAAVLAALAACAVAGRSQAFYAAAGADVARPGRGRRVARASRRITSTSSAPFTRRLPRHPAARRRVDHRDRRRPRAAPTTCRAPRPSSARLRPAGHVRHRRGPRRARIVWHYERRSASSERSRSLTGSRAGGGLRRRRRRQPQGLGRRVGAVARPR